MSKVLDANTAQDYVGDIPLQYLKGMLKDAIRYLNDNDVTVTIDATGLSLN